MKRPNPELGVDASDAVRRWVQEEKGGGRGQRQG